MRILIHLTWFLGFTNSLQLPFITPPRKRPSGPEKQKTVRGPKTTLSLRPEAAQRPKPSGSKRSSVPALQKRSRRPDQGSSRSDHAVRGDSRRLPVRSSDDSRAGAKARGPSILDELSEGGSSEDLHCVGDPDQISDLIGYTEDFDITFHTQPIIFDKAISHVVAGSALVAQHLLDSGELDVVAVYLVRGTRPQKNGLLVDASLVGISNKTTGHLKKAKKGSVHVLHLCNGTSGCSSLSKQQDLTHVFIWRASVMDEAPDSWISKPMRKEFAKQYDAMEADEEDHSAPPSAGTAGPRPSDDELLERRRAALKTFQLPSSVVSQRVSALLPKKKVTFQEEPPFPPPMEKPLPLTSPPGYFGEVAADSEDDEPETKVKPAASDEKPLSRLKALAETNLSPDEVEKSASSASTDKVTS